jgi:hypothetical protein
MAFYGEHTVDMNDQPWSGRPVTATYELRREKVAFIQEN